MSGTAKALHTSLEKMPAQPINRHTFRTPHFQRKGAPGGETSVKKFKIPANPLQLENVTREITPLPESLTEETWARIMLKGDALLASENPTQEEKSAIRNRAHQVYFDTLVEEYAKDDYKNLRAGVKSDFAADFRLWLANHHKYEIPTVKYDARSGEMIYPLPAPLKKPTFMGKVASGYIRKHIRASYNFLQRLTRIAQGEFKDLNDYYLYFKYIVKGTPVRGTDGNFLYSEIDDSFLKRFRMGFDNKGLKPPDFYTEEQAPFGASPDEWEQPPTTTVASSVQPGDTPPPGSESSSMEVEDEETAERKRNTAAGLYIPDPRKARVQPGPHTGRSKRQAANKATSGFTFAGEGDNVPHASESTVAQETMPVQVGGQKRPKGKEEEEEGDQEPPAKTQVAGEDEPPPLQPVQEAEGEGSMNVQVGGQKRPSEKRGRSRTPRPRKSAIEVTSTSPEVVDLTTPEPSNKPGVVDQDAIEATSGIQTAEERKRQAAQHSLMLNKVANRIMRDGATFTDEKGEKHNVDVKSLSPAQFHDLILKIVDQHRGSSSAPIGVEEEEPVQPTQKQMNEAIENITRSNLQAALKKWTKRNMLERREGPHKMKERRRTRSEERQASARSKTLQERRQKVEGFLAGLEDASMEAERKGEKRRRDLREGVASKVKTPKSETPQKLAAVFKKRSEQFDRIHQMKADSLIKIASIENVLSQPDVLVGSESHKVFTKELKEANKTLAAIKDLGTEKKKKFMEEVAAIQSELSEEEKGRLKQDINLMKLMTKLRAGQNHRLSHDVIERKLATGAIRAGHAKVLHSTLATENVKERIIHSVQSFLKRQASDIILNEMRLTPETPTHERAETEKSEMLIELKKQIASGHWLSIDIGKLEKAGIIRKTEGNTIRRHLEQLRKYL